MRRRASCPGPSRLTPAALLTPFPFVEWRAGRDTARAMHAVFALTNWVLYIVLPLFLFLRVQLKFLPYQASGSRSSTCC